MPEERGIHTPLRNQDVHVNAIIFWLLQFFNHGEIYIRKHLSFQPLCIQFTGIIYTCNVCNHYRYCQNLPSLPSYIYRNGIIYYVVFSGWLLSVRVRFLRFIQQAAVLHSFLWLNNIPSYGQTTFSLSINRWIDIWVSSTSWLL